MEVKDNKKNYIYLASLISALAVVALHVNFNFWIFSKEPHWFWENIVECLFYFAVPVFYMLSGITLIDYNLRYSTKTFFLKRLSKTFIPFVFWSLFGLIYGLFITKTIPIHKLSPSFVINGVLNNSFVPIYWFFIPLFILYLTIPVLSAIKPEKRIRVYSYIVLLMALINSLIPLIINLFSLKIYYSLSFIIGCNAVLYALIGYILSQITLSRKQINIIIILGVIGLLAHIIGTYQLSMAAGRIIDVFKGYYNIPCILYSVAIFVFLKSISHKLFEINFLKKGVYFLKNYTFAIYLLHFFIINYITQVLKYDINSLLLFFESIIICILITYLIRKIPILRKLLP